MTVEPRVEELLATIRKAIDHDISELDKANPNKPPRATGNMSGAMREMRVTYGEPSPSRQEVDQELARLRQRVGRPKLESQFPSKDSPPITRPTVLGEPRGGQVSSILAGQREPLPPLRQPLPLRQSFAREVEELPQPTRIEPLPPAPVDYSPYPAEPVWAPEPQMQADPYYQPAPPQALMSPQAAYAAQSSFQALTNALMAQVGGDGRLEDMAKEIMRPMLKQWLDDQLPTLVEKLVREEIERVARRGR